MPSKTNDGRQPPRNIFEKRVNRRDALVASSLGVAGFFISACGGSSPSTGGGGTISGKPGTASVMFDMEYGGVPGSMAKYWKKLAAAAQRERSLNVSLSQVNYSNLDARLQAAHAAKDGPTLQTFYPGFPSFPFGVAGSIVPVGPFLRGANKVEDWLFAVDGYQIDGEYWGVPFYAEQALLAANRKVLAEAGIDLGERFESWDEFVSVAERAKQGGIDAPVMIGAADGFNAEKWIQAGSMSEVSGFATLADFAIGNVGVDEPGVATWADWFTDMREKRIMNGDAGDITEQQAITRFLGGEGAFMMVYPGAVFTAKNADDFQIVGYPGGPSPLAAPAAVAGDILMFTSYGEDQEGSADLCDFLMETPQLQMFNKITGEFPCNRNFDSSGLERLPSEAWDLLTSSDPAPVWIHNFMPRAQVTALYDLGPRSVKGEDPDSIRAGYEKRMKTFQEQNAAEASLVQQFVDQLEE